MHASMQVRFIIAYLHNIANDLVSHYSMVTGKWI